MTPINFGLPGFFKASVTTTSDGCGWSVYVSPPITGNTFAYHFEADQQVFNDTSETCAADTDSVRQIYDQSGNNNTANQSDSGKQPVYDVDAVNGSNAITVDNTDEMSLGTTISSEDYTVYAVYKKGLSTDAQSLLGDSTNTNGVILNWTGNAVYFFNSVGAYRSFVADSDFTNYAIRTFKNFSSNGTFEGYENDFLIGSTSNVSLGTTNIDSLFRRSGRTGSLSVADMSIYTEAHSASTITQITEWLNDKYKFFGEYGGASLPPITTNLEDYTSPDHDMYTGIGANLAVNNQYIRSSRGQYNDIKKVQHTANDQPQLKVGTFGDFNSVYKLGTDRLKFNAKEIQFTPSESFIIYSVFQRVDNGSCAIYSKVNSGVLDWGNGVIYIMDDSSGYNNHTLGYTTDKTIRAYQINRSTNTCIVYDNGVQVASFGISSVDDNITIDTIYNRGTGNGTGIIHYGDTLLYRSLHSDTDRNTIMNWLNKKYNVHSYLTQQGGTLPVTSNLLLRIEGNAGVYSDAGTTPVIDTDSIRQVDDFSSNSNDLDQSTASNQLTYETNHFNRKDFIKHLPGDYLSPTTSFNLSGGTVYVTGKKALEGSDWWFIGGDNNACMGNFSSGVMSLYDGTNYNTISSGHLTQHAVYAIVWNFGSTYEVFENGVSLGTANVSNVGPINNVKVFGRGSETGASVNYFGDLLVYSDVHTSTQVEQISDYLTELRYEVDSYTKEPTYKKFLLHHFEAGSSSYKTDNFSPVSGETIQVVNDLTHNNNNGTVSSTAPTYHSSGVDINNKPYIQLGGGSGVVNLDKSLTFERKQDWTIFAVVKKDTASDVLVLYGGPINNAFFSDYSDGKMYFVSPGHATDFSSMGTDWCIISAVYDASTNTITVNKNGSLLGTDTTWDISGNYTIDRLFNRGNTITTSGSYVAECMLYGTKLSSTEIAAEESRLNTKYDIY